MLESDYESAGFLGARTRALGMTVEIALQRNQAKTICVCAMSRRHRRTDAFEALDDKQAR